MQEGCFIQKKRSSFLRKMNSRSGVILIIVLWVLVIISALAISLGRKTNIELTLTKHMISKAKAKYFMWAGIIYAIRHIQIDSENKESSAKDTAYMCGISIDENISPEDLFKERKVGAGQFSISYKQLSDDALASVSGTVIGETYSGNRTVTIESEKEPFKQKKLYYGFSDEERKINLNGLNKQNFKILSKLLVYLGYDDDVANIVAASVVDWKDGDSAVTSGVDGAEDEYYESMAMYSCKNMPFDSKEELLAVRGVTKEMYNAIKDYVTVFPKGLSLKINFDTATKPVLYSVARTVSDASPVSDETDADSLVEKIITYRKGDDSQEYTSDDNVVDSKGLALNALERNIFLGMNRYRTKKSSYININVTGVEQNIGAVSQVEAIVFRDDLSVVYWRRY